MKKTLCALVASIGISANAQEPAFLEPVLEKPVELKTLGTGVLGDSGASFSARLEIPKESRISLRDGCIKMGEFNAELSANIEIEDVTFRNKLVSKYFSNLTSDNYKEEILIGDYNLGDFQEAFEIESKQFPSFAKELYELFDLKRDDFLNNKIKYDHSLFPGEILDYQDLWVYFVHLFSESGKDGVISPLEAFRMGDKTNKQSKKAYSQLNDEQKVEIERIAKEFYNDYLKDIEDKVSDYDLDYRFNSLKDLKKTDDVMIGPYPLQVYMDMFKSIEPLLQIDSSDDYLKVFGKVFGSYEKKNDLFSSIVFDDFIFMYGNHSYSVGHGSVKLDLSLELVATDVIHDFDKYDPYRVEYELLTRALGYNPRMVNIVSAVNASLDIKERITLLKGYELFPENGLGFGIATGWRKNQKHKINVNASGKIDLFKGTVNADLNAKRYSKVEKGRRTYAYFIKNLREKDYWATLSLGGKHDLFREDIKRESIVFSYFNNIDEEERVTNNTEKFSKQEVRSVLSGVMSLQAGITLPHGNPYIFVDSLRRNAGLGVMLNTEYLLSHIKSDSDGLVSAHSLLPLKSSLDKKLVDKYFKELQNHGSSLFPARDVVLSNALNNLYTNLDGILIEALVNSYIAENKDSKIFKLGLVGANTNLCVRGGISVMDSDNEVIGVYLGGGNKRFMINGSATSEKEHNRDTKANSIALSAYANFSNFRLRTVLDLERMADTKYMPSLEKPKYQYSLFLELL